jgi:hypothetical protein
MFYFWSVFVLLLFMPKAWIDAFSGVREVKREPSVSFDKSEMNPVNNKRLNRVLEVKREYPNKQVPTDSL